MRLNRKRRRGSAAVTTIGIAAVILVFGIFFLDMLALYDAQYNIGVRAQRGLNSIVEYAMDDSKRWDGYNYIEEPVARARWKEFMDDSLGVNAGGAHYANGKLQYDVGYSGLEIWPGSKTKDAYMKVTVTVHLHSGIARYFGRDGYTWTNTFISTNFRTDDNYRAGI